MCVSRCGRENLPEASASSPGGRASGGPETSQPRPEVTRPGSRVFSGVPEDHQRLFPSRPATSLYITLQEDVLPSLAGQWFDVRGATTARIDNR